LIIKESKITKHGSKYRLEATAQYNGGDDETIWYEVDEELSQFLTDRMDAFLVVFLMQAMSVGEDIHVEGTISEKLFYNVYNHFMPIMRTLVPELKNVEITAANLSNAPLKCKNHTVTGFSAGIDSLCLINDNLAKSTPESYRITDLVFYDVGSHSESKELFEKRYKRLSEDALKIGFPLRRIESNIDSILNVDFTRTCTLRNVSVILILQGLFSKYLCASGVSYIDSMIKETEYCDYADAATLPLLSTETLECISSGGQYSRTEKTKIVTEMELSQNMLDVCITDMPEDKPHNCSYCFKCLRTIITLEILGKLDLYKTVFDIDRFNKYRYFYYILSLSKNCVFAQEILILANEENYKLPIGTKTLAFLYSFKIFQLTKPIIKKIISPLTNKA